MHVVAAVRGFMTHKGVPDYQRAARFILKDFVTVCPSIILLLTSGFSAFLAFCEWY